MLLDRFKGRIFPEGINLNVWTSGLKQPQFSGRERKMGGMGSGRGVVRGDESSPNTGRGGISISWKKE